MRRSRSIAAVLGGAGLTLVCATAFTIWAQGGATADEPLPDDEIIAAGVADLPPFMSAAAPAAPVADTSSALASDAPPAPVEWIQEGVREIDTAAAPALREAERLTTRYEPRLSVRMNEGEDEVPARTEVALALAPQAGPAKAAAASLEQKLDRLATRLGAAEDFGQKPRWFVFAASDNQAVGLNMLRGRKGELKRAGFTAEKVAAIGDAQVGVGWRKGPFQAALSFIDRKISAFGEDANERFLAFTVSIKPTRQTSVARPRRPADARPEPAAPAQPARETVPAAR